MQYLKIAVEMGKTKTPFHQSCSHLKVLAWDKSQNTEVHGTDTLHLHTQACQLTMVSLRKN